MSKHERDNNCIGQVRKKCLGENKNRSKIEKYAQNIKTRDGGREIGSASRRDLKFLSVKKSKLRELRSLILALFGDFRSHSMSMICNLTKGALTLIDQSLTCDGTQETTPYAGLDPILVTGNSNATFLDVRHARVVLILQGVFAGADAATSISSSSVELILRDVNNISSTSVNSDFDVHAGLDCSSGSNLTLTGETAGRLFVRGGIWAAGIGSREGGSCASVSILNG
jgi:hypothetical protein